MALIGMVFVGACAAAILAKVHSIYHIGTWLFFVVANILIRFVIITKTKTLDNSDNQHKAYNIEKVFCLSAAISALIWNSGMVLFFPSDNPLLQSFVAFVTAGITAGAIASYSLSPMTFNTYIPLLVVPVIAVFALQGTYVHYIMASMIAIYGVIIQRIASKTHKYAVENIKSVIEHKYISEQLQIRNQELRIAQRKAEEASDLKSQFVANMSHEIRTPINGILGMTTLLAETPLNEQQKDYLQKIGSSSDSLLALVNNVLDLSKIEAKKMEIHHDVFSIFDVLHDISNIAQSLVFSSQVSFSVNNLIKDDMQYISTDMNKVKQVLINLIGNAVKFTKKGTITLHARITVTPQKSYTLVLSVEDSGKGIKSEDLKRIFNSFAQVDSSTTRTAKGTGLGLAISQKIAYLLNGDIKVQSQEAKGSIFTLSVPVKVKREVSLIKKPPLPIKRSPSEKSSLRILVAEDDPVNQQVIQAYLKLLGYSCDIKANGQEAITALEGNDYDIFFVDLHMPVLDGVETVAKIRKNPRWEKLKIIAVSASVLKDYIDKFFSMGGNDVLRKPFRKQELESILIKHTLKKTIKEKEA